MAEDFEQRLQQIQLHDDERNVFLEDLLQKYRQTLKELREAKIELEDEKKVRRLYAKNIDSSEDELKSVRHMSFVLVLIDGDADGYLFDNAFIMRGAQGGFEAANKLCDTVRNDLSKHVQGIETVPIVLRAFANIDGLCSTFLAAGFDHLARQLPEFYKGFSQVDLCDFVCVGRGKDRADEKVKATFDLFLANPTCGHIVLAACHDNGYVRLLEKIRSERLRNKVTLVKCCQTANEFLQLEMRMTRLPKLFRSTLVRPNKNAHSAAIAGRKGLEETNGSAPPSYVTTAGLPEFVPQPPDGTDVTNTTKVNAKTESGNGSATGQTITATAEARKSLEKKLREGRRFCRAHFIRGCCRPPCSYLHSGLSEDERVVWKESWFAKESGE